jgi:ribonuclease HI
MEYRGVETYSKKEIFIQGPFRDGTNNIGEFLALVHALALLKKLGKDDVTIYSDSRTAMSWVKKEKPIQN